MALSGERYNFEDISSKVIGVALCVHRNLGAHFQELTYQRALAVELNLSGISFGREVRIPIHYRGKRIHTRRVDFVVDEILVEIKAKAILEERDFEQTLSYLKASGFKIALLLNFGQRKLGIKRIVN